MLPSWAVPVIALAIIATVRAGFLSGGFVWLDHGDIEDGRAIVPLSGLLSAFGKPFAATGFYRPLVTIVHSLDASLWGKWASGWHFTNLALFCAAALAVPLFLSAFRPLSNNARLAAMLIFGLHPIGMLTAGCISFRSESLLALFLFLSAWIYARARTSPSAPRTAALFATAAAAALSKETAFFYLPAFLAIWELSGAPGKRCGTQSKITAASVVPAAAVALALVVVFCLRLAALPQVWRETAASLPAADGSGMRLALVFRQAINLLSPLPAGISDASRIEGPLGLLPLAGLGLVIATLCVLRRGVRQPLPQFLLLTAMALLPALNLIPLPRFHSPHYALIAIAPGTGCVLLLGEKIRLMMPRLRPLLIGMAAAWLGMAAFSSVNAGARFRSDLTLFGPEVSRDRHLLEGWFYIGNYYMFANDPQRAFSAFESGLMQDPAYVAFVDRPGALMNQGNCAVMMDKLGTADSLLRLAAGCAPVTLQGDIAFNRAWIADRLGAYDSVIVLLGDNRECQHRAGACAMLGKAFEKRGRLQEANEMYGRALALQAGEK